MRNVGGGSAAEVDWQCTGAGEKRWWWMMVLLEVGQDPRNKWCAGSVRVRESRY